VFALLWCAIAAGENAAPGNGLSSLSQLVRHFDFEEAEQAPFEMPLNFYRYGADEGGIAQGFPPFGTMRLTRDVAATGKWSFMFELDGGSMAARVPSAVIPVMPGADYTVAVRVRTEGLTHARARLVAWLYDEHGQIIADSRSESEFVQTSGGWQVLATRLHGQFDDATDLGIELQLLQPRQFLARDGGPYQPTLADVHGHAYFDDVSVWQEPRIHVGTNQPGNVVVAPETPELVIQVHDVVQRDLGARLQVFDVDGNVVFERAFPAPRSPRQRIVALPIERFGWYRAALDIHLGGQLAARHWTDLAYLPPPRRVSVGRHDRFTLTLPESWQEHQRLMPDLIHRLGVGAVIMPVLFQSMTKDDVHDWYQQSRPTIERLRREHIDLTFSLDGVPDRLARSLDIDTNEVVVALHREPIIWRDYLDDLIVNYSFEVPRWQIGRSGSDAAAWIHDAPTLIDHTATALRRLVPGGSVLIPTLATNEPEALSAHAAYHVAIPEHVAPAGVEPYVRLWSNHTDSNNSADATSADGTLIEIEPVMSGRYAHRDRAIDLMLRVLHAWRAGPVNLSMRPPWRDANESVPSIMPEETLPVWNQLIDQLRGRQVVGELAIGRGAHCWLLSGVNRDDAALLAWKEPGATVDRFEMQLADGPVTVTDGFGNRHTAPLLNDSHTVKLEEMPRFVEGINLELVQFRGGFSLDPDFLPVEARIHEHELVLRNPWPMPVNGTIRIRDMDNINFMPKSHRFSIESEDELRLPVQIQLARGIMAGTKRIKADIMLTADGQYELTLFKDITVGLEHIDFAATSRRSRNPDTGEDDLVITQYITNTGEQPMNLEAFMLGRGVAHERRLIAGLKPGEMAIRVFTIPDGANRLEGEGIRVGVIERDGVGRLNQVIEVPTPQGPRHRANP